MEEIIEVRFANDEKDFIYNQGVNKGYFQAYSKVARNYILSTNGRSLYNLLSSYASLNEEKMCFPSRETIKAELGGWSNDRYTKAVEELSDANLIHIKDRPGKVRLYYIQDLHRSPLIAHSEFIHSIRVLYKAESMLNLFYKALAKYRVSDLCVKVKELPSPLVMEQEIREFFTTYIEESQPEPKPVKEKKAKPFIGPLINETGLSRTTSEDPLDEKPKKKKKSKDYKGVDVVEWNTTHFLRFFEDVWLEKKGLPYPTKLKEDLGALKHIITQTSNNEAVKTMIEKYFEMDLDSSKHSIRNFSSAFVQQKLINALNSPSNNSYMNKRQSTGMTVDDEWLKQYLDGEEE